MEANSNDLRLKTHRKRKSDQQTLHQTNDMVSTDNTPDQQAKRAKEATEIIDLSDDCLYEIFKYFDTNDLATVAGTNVRFLHAARDVFQRKDAKHEIAVSNDPKRQQKTITLLKRLGDLIAKLKVVLVRFDQRLELAIGAYCCSSLTEITLNGVQTHTFAEAHQPFENVARVCLNGGFGANLIYKFNTLFPNATKLELINMEFRPDEDARCVQQYFPSLSHLAVIDAGERSMFAGENLKAIIRANPHLRSVKLQCAGYINKFLGDNARIETAEMEIVKFIEFINRQLPQLETLYLDRLVNVFPKLRWDFVRPERQICFEHLKELTIHFDNCLSVPRIRSDRLNRLAVEHHYPVFEMPQRIRDDVIELIASNRNISSLCLSVNSFEHFPFEKVLDCLPNLTFLNVRARYPIRYEKMVWILDNGKKLTMFTIHQFMTPYAAERFKSKFDADRNVSEWTMERVESGITLRRK